jgi:biopolymer transport protein ExbD
MRRFSDRHGLSTLSELNVTPLLDLAFVLLIIFMITTPLMDNSMDLQLPKSGSAQPPPDQTQVETIAIDRESNLQLNGRALSLDELEAELTALQGEKPETAVVVRSHRELPVQKLVDILDVVKAAKITKVGVITNPEE